MSTLKQEIADATGQAGNDAALEMETLIEIVEAELDNIAGGGYEQYSATHMSDIAMDNMN